MAGAISLFTNQTANGTSPVTPELNGTYTVITTGTLSTATVTLNLNGAAIPSAALTSSSDKVFNLERVVGTLTAVVASVDGSTDFSMTIQKVSL